MNIGRRQLQSCIGSLIAVFAIWSPAAAEQDNSTKGEDVVRHEAMESRNSDYEIKSRIEKRLRLEDDIQWSNLSVHVNEGHVILNGIVSTLEDKALASKLATTVPGVTELENRILLDSRVSHHETTKPPHIETKTRDRVLERPGPLEDRQLMP